MGTVAKSIIVTGRVTPPINYNLWGGCIVYERTKRKVIERRKQTFRPYKRNALNWQKDVSLGLRLYQAALSFFDSFFFGVKEKKNIKIIKISCNNKAICFHQRTFCFFVKGSGGTFDVPPRPLNNPLTPFERVLNCRTASVSKTSTFVSHFLLYDGSF